MLLSQEAVIGVAIVCSVVGTVALVLAIIGCFYCIRRCKARGGEKYCTAGEIIEEIMGYASILIRIRVTLISTEQTCYL